MAKKIIWTVSAQEDRKSILLYWNKRNKSNAYSLKLNKLFIEATEILALRPLTGRLTNLKDIRVKIVIDYLLVYKHSDTEILVLAIFDSRQDPDLFENILKSSI